MPTVLHRLIQDASPVDFKLHHYPRFISLANFAGICSLRYRVASSFHRSRFCDTETCVLTIKTLMIRPRRAQSRAAWLSHVPTKIRFTNGNTLGLEYGIICAILDSHGLIVPASYRDVFVGEITLPVQMAGISRSSARS
jgi:hypothetical protein